MRLTATHWRRIALGCALALAFGLPTQASTPLLVPLLRSLGEVPTPRVGQQQGGKKKKNQQQNQKKKKAAAPAPKKVSVPATPAKKSMAAEAGARLGTMDAASISPQEREAFEKERQRLVAQQFAADMADQQRFREELKTMRLTPETVNRPDAEGERLLHKAVRRNWRLAVEDLMAKGADPTIKDLGGNSALDLARMVGDAQMIQALTPRAQAR